MVMERSIGADDGDVCCWLSTRRRHLWSYWGLDGSSIDHTKPLHWPWSSWDSIDDLSSSSARRCTTGGRPAESQPGTAFQFLRSCLVPGIFLAGNDNIGYVIVAPFLFPD